MPIPQWKRALPALALCAALAGAAPMAQAQWRTTCLGDPGGRCNGVSGLNAAARWSAAATPGGTTHAFIWEAGRMTYLGTLGGASSAGHAISANGQVTGSSSLAGNGGVVDLGTLDGARNSHTSALNDAGRAIGASAGAGNGTHAFLYSAGALRDLGTLGGISSEARALNDAGMVAGWSWSADGEQHPFVLADGVMHALGAVGGVGTGDGMAVAINASGQVAGLSSTDYGASFFYSGGKMIDLGARLRGRYHAVEHRVYLNDAGQVAGVAAIGLARRFPPNRTRRI